MAVIRITPAGTIEKQPGNAAGVTGEFPACFDMLGPVQAAGAFFLPMGPKQFNGYVQMFTSSDGGNTWAPDSSGVKQACRNWCADWNPTTGLFTVAYLANTNPGAQNPVQLRQYNPSTQTWGTVLSPAGPSTLAVLTVRTRANGDIIVVHVNTTPQYNASVFSGGTWTSVNLDAGLGDIVPADPAATSAIDAANVLHIGAVFTAGGGDDTWFYFRLLTNNTLLVNGGTGGVSFILVDVDPNADFGACAVSDAGDYVAFPWLGNSSSNLNIEFVRGLSASPPAIQNVVASAAGDYVGGAGGGVFLGPAASVFGGTLYVASSVNGNAAVSVSTSELTPTGVYTRAQMVALASEPSLGSGPVAGLMFAGSARLAFNSTDAGTGLAGRYVTGVLGASCNNPPAGYLGRNYSHTFGATSGTPPYTFSLSAGAFPPGLTLNASTGVLSGRPTKQGTFAFTLEVTDSAAATATVNCSITILMVAPFVGGGGGYRPSRCGCSPQQLEAERVRQLMRRRGAWPYAHLFPPDGAVPVEQVAGITAPGGTATVFQYKVPSGCRFVMAAILQAYAGGAFTVGGAVWTVDQNSGAPNTQASPVQGLADVPIPLGSITDGYQWPFEMPYIFAPLTLLRSRVTDNIGSGSYTSGFFGFLLPDVKKSGLL